MARNNPEPLHKMRQRRSCGIEPLERKKEVHQKMTQNAQAVLWRGSQQNCKPQSRAKGSKGPQEPAWQGGAGKEGGQKEALTEGKTRKGSGCSGPFDPLRPGTRKGMASRCLHAYVQK